jgi:hypothetical protein
MQRIYLSAGKAQCRFCGEHVSTNQLSIHIAQAHARPRRTDLSPTLVLTKRAAKPADSAK